MVVSSTNWLVDLGTLAVSSKPLLNVCLVGLPTPCITENEVLTVLYVADEEKAGVSGQTVLGTNVGVHGSIGEAVGTTIGPLRAIV